jgi:hypothetical protein
VRFPWVVMAALRGALPLILTGTSGLALLGLGLTGLSGMDPQLARAARTVQLQHPHPTAPDRAVPVAPNRLVDCPPHHRDRDEV